MFGLFPLRTRSSRYHSIFVIRWRICSSTAVLIAMRRLRAERFSSAVRYFTASICSKFCWFSNLRANLQQIFEIAKFFTTNPLNIYIYKDFCNKFGCLHNSANVNSRWDCLWQCRCPRSYNYFILIYASFLAKIVLFHSFCTIISCIFGNSTMSKINYPMF